MLTLVIVEGARYWGSLAVVTVVDAILVALIVLLIIIIATGR